MLTLNQISIKTDQKDINPLTKKELIELMFGYIGIDGIINFEKLVGRTIDRDILLKKTLYPVFLDLIPQIKNYYSSDYLKALQTNAVTNQKFWLINLFRQILTAEGYRMKPEKSHLNYTSHSYTSHGNKRGKKILKRWFRFMRRV